MRQLITSFVLGALMLSFTPFTFAQEADDERPERPVREGRMDFCENLDQAKEQVLAKLEERKGGPNREGDHAGKRDERLSELDITRAEKDSSRDSKYEQLRERATTDEQSAAVETFISTVETLVAERRAAVDAAIADFEAAVEALLAERDEAVGDYASKVELEIENVFEDAEANCENNMSGAKVREELREDMSLLRDSIRGDRDEYSFKDELESARETRKAATEAAKADFQSGYEAAKADLKAAFGAE